MLHVDATPLEGRPHLTRYWLTLADHSDPITLIVKETTAREALFYQHLAPELANLTPYCWYQEIHGDLAWVVLADEENNRPVTRWRQPDLQHIMEGLATLHATFWDQSAYWRHQSWLPTFPPAGRSRPLDPPGARPPWRHFVSGHALRAAGDLAPQLKTAAAGLAALRLLGGWPGVLDERHLEAVADLLDDPVPVLQPLRELPPTLLHGRPEPEHWGLNWFGQPFLLDWRHSLVGPAALDLIYLVESYVLARSQRRAWSSRRQRSLVEQTLVDDYLLRMSSTLGRRFSARQLRQALPAARCLYVLTHWFPRFADWFAEADLTMDQWQAADRLTARQLRQVGLGPVAELRFYLNDLFHHFLQAYRTL